MFDRETNTAFLNAIRERPDDDAPRLIYADWLDEQGEEDRAELIRAQIRLQSLPATTPEYRTLTERIVSLQRQHGIEWRADYPQITGVHWEEVWDRGFISAVRFDNADLFRSYSEEVFNAAPITELRLHGFYWPDAVYTAEAAWLRNVRILDLAGSHVSNKGLEALMASPHLSKLNELKLGRNHLGSAGVRAIAESPYMKQLRVLELQMNDIYDEGVRALAQSPILAHLQKLDLDHTRTSDTGVIALANSPHLLHLHKLYLSSNQITDTGLMALANSPVLQHVQHLFLQANQLGPEGITALAQSNYSLSLRHLFLRNNRIRDAGADALIASHLVNSLSDLYVGGNGLSDFAADQLRLHYGSRVVVH